MGSFGRGSGSATHDGPTETKVGKVMNVKASPERGKKRLSMVSKTGGRLAFLVDIPYSEAKNIERKSMIEMEVYEKPDEAGARGGNQKRASSIGTRTYCCDDAPTPYNGSHKPQFKSFGGGDDKKGGTSSRLKF